MVTSECMEVSYIFKYAIWGAFVALLIKEIFAFLRGEQSKKWRRHKGIVVDIKVEVKKYHDTDDDFIGDEEHYSMPFVRYEYQYSGKKYKSKREPLNDTWSSDIGDSSSAVVGINPGSEIIIFINPKKPKQSVLKKGYRGRHLKELFALFLFALTVELFSK